MPSTKNCVTCHPDRIEPHGYFAEDHQSDIAAQSISGGYPGGITYGPIACNACHMTELFPEHQRGTSSSVSDGCGNCHPSPKDSLTPSWSKGCVQGGCHPPATPTAQHAAMATGHALPPADAACAAAGCHDQGDLGAIHADAPGECTVCHSTLTVPTEKIRENCHGQPHGDLSAAHTANEPGGMTWANTGAYAPCTQCHFLDIRDEHAKASSGALGCEACHAAGGPVSQLPAGGWNGQCSACHTSIHPEYDAEHIAYGQDCADCHGDPADARDFHYSCGVSPSDGATPNPEMLPCHVGPDYVPYPRLGAPYTNGYWCRTCHPEE